MKPNPDILPVDMVERRYILRRRIQLNDISADAVETGIGRRT